MSRKSFGGPDSRFTTKMITARPELTNPSSKELIKAVYFFTIHTFPKLVSRRVWSCSFRARRSSLLLPGLHHHRGHERGHPADGAGLGDTESPQH
jgi:hypothetical protein